MADLTVASDVDSFMAAANKAAMLAVLDITLGGAFTTSGAFTTTLTVTGDTNVTLPTSGTLAILGANTFTGAQIISANGAASTPAMLLSGSPFTGGTGTTTKPLALFETAGATSTGWNVNGTMHGVNGPSGFAGNLADWQLNGSSVVALPAADGKMLFNTFDGPHAGAGIYIGTGGTENLHLTANQGLNLSKNHVVGWVDAFNTAVSPTSGFTWGASAVTKFYNPSSGAGAGLEMVEMTAPAAAPANSGRLFLQDNGAGKTQLMIIFASGAAQQIAIEP